MSSYPSEWDRTEEEEQPVIEAEHEPPQPAFEPHSGRQAPPPRMRQRQPERRRRSDKLSRLALVISILALILAGTALFLTLRPEPEPEEPSDISEEEPVTFPFQGQMLTPLEGMPLNPYDREAFSLDELGRLTYEKDGKRARTGIDVSVHQQEIDWQAVAADGIDFAILRLGRRGGTEGGLYIDDRFERNLQGALDAGLDVGVYFFSQAITPEEAEEEANYVLSTLDGRKLTYPVAFDWENIVVEGGARTDNLDGETMTLCAAAFCKTIQEAGYRPAVYFNQTQGYLRYDLRELTAYDLWLAEYGEENKPDSYKPDFYYHFDLLQYRDNGTVAGIDGDVDLDLDLR